MPLPIVDSTKSSDDLEARRTHRRFDRAARLFTEPGLHRLMDARVLIFGVGGVGSFAAEALARSAVGEIVLIDFDDVCVTNANRQLHALKGNIGKKKVDVMAERLRAINPTAKIVPVTRFYDAGSSDELLEGRIDFVLDAIDNITAKAHLIATCVARGIPIASSMGAAARLDPTRIRAVDLTRTERDPFARALRRVLREKYGFAMDREREIGVDAIVSDEEPRDPSPLAYDAAEGFVCVCPSKDNGLHTCERRTRIDGSASFVTGAFGLALASIAVRRLTKEL